MPHRKLPETLSEGDLRRLLAAKLRASRQGGMEERLEHYRRTGRLVTLVSDQEAFSQENWHTDLLPLDDESTVSSVSAVRKSILGRFLVVIEAMAILGFVFILYSGSGMLRTLNRESVQAQKLPPLTPTPLIASIELPVLPDGHTPPNSPGGARFNESEIPEALRPLVRSQASIPIPTPDPGNKYGVRIQIPAIKVDATIVQGDGWEQLKLGVAQHLGTPDPGENGNIVLSGHNDVFGEVFRYLDQLKPGDSIFLFTKEKSYTYIVIATNLVKPTAVEVMDQTADATVTLISCYPYLVDNQRIIVTGKLLKG